MAHGRYSPPSIAHTSYWIDFQNFFGMDDLQFDNSLLLELRQRSFDVPLLWQAFWKRVFGSYKILDESSQRVCDIILLFGYSNSNCMETEICIVFPFDD